MIRARILLATMLACALVAAGCTDSSDDDAPAPEGSHPPVGPAVWEPCPDLPEEVVGDLVPSDYVGQLTAHMTYDCATIAVPQDWAEPEGPTFDISLLRARHQDQTDPIGSLVVNPGGPGGSGVDNAVYLSFGSQLGGLPDEVTHRFDIVGFDPRGVKRSSPVDCFTDADLDESFGAEPDPNSEQFRTQLDDYEQVVQACEQKYGDTLGLYSTHQTARDMDAIRKAVSDEQLTYLGFSYGTLLGAVYAHLFPDNVRAMVLDGAVNPGRDRVAKARTQAEGFERAFDNFADWCAQAPSTECPLGDEARSAVTDVLAQAREAPATDDSGRTATAGWVFTAVISALYSQQTWAPLAAAIDQLQDGDPDGVFQLADAYAERGPDGEYSNLFDANNAISCADDDSPPMESSEVQRLQEEWRAEMPLFGGAMAAGLATCDVWPAEPDPYPYGKAVGAPPILVVGTTGDPATPYELTEDLAETLGVGVVLTLEGEGHTAYPEDPCIAEAVDAYLVDLTPPADGTTC